MTCPFFGNVFYYMKQRPHLRLWKYSMRMMCSSHVHSRLQIKDLQLSIDFLNNIKSQNQLAAISKHPVAHILPKVKTPSNHCTELKYLRLQINKEASQVDCSGVYSQLTLVESLTSICASSFPLMLKLQKRPLS